MSSTARNIAIVAVMLAALWTGMATQASAQTIASPDANPFVTNSISFQGQSFTATVTGTVTRIRVRPGAAQNTTLYLYNGANTGAFNAAGAFVSSQAVSLTDRTGGGFDEFVLGTPLPVTAGSTYAFAFGSSTLTRNNDVNSYPGGAWFANGDMVQAQDLIFEVVQVAAAPVPTLSEWAMILLGLALAGAAAVHLQRRARLAGA
ncbi:IPTL-CTERM sorting domain-containing protein [Brevundimonas sp.]|uniref:IPTL-CTERM sorting domain-containing protein n=1 Tax=Brevundimonas sp. TaxID=1871086 RepID=UPI00260308AB|nr:IPTL-CTERM sorting domain-containing protein [Brevundimonas sp.]